MTDVGKSDGLCIIVRGSKPCTYSPLTIPTTEFVELLPEINGSSISAEIILSTLKTLKVNSFILPSDP